MRSTGIEPNGKRLSIIVAILAVFLISGIVYVEVRDSGLKQESESEQVDQSVDPLPSEPSTDSQVTVEDEPRSYLQPRLLREYGSETKTARDDLQLVEDVLSRFWTLLKNPDLLRVGSNAEIVETLTGANPEGIEFISPSNRFINTEGELLDRWGTPLFFHPISMKHIEIRSAGPDRKLFSDDDVFLGDR